MDQHKESLIQEIIALELPMFQQVNSRGPAVCQERPDTFKIMRWMAHSVLALDTLAAWRDDLAAATDAGRNLMTEKYARMENLIPPLKSGRAAQLIAEIVASEAAWMQDLSARFPDVFPGGGGAAFQNYLAGELETYSETTIALYHRDITSAREAGRNLSEESYTNLFTRLGYASLEEVQAGSAGK